MKGKKNIAELKKNVIRESEEPKNCTAIQGYDFNKGVNYDKLIDSYLTTGFQATHLAQAIEIIKQMREEECTIYLGYTSNMVTSGLRDIFCYLAEHKMVDVIVTTAGGIEEDIIKCLGPFLLGDFRLNGKQLRDKGINRIGNILVPNERYIKFEDFLIPILDKIKEPINPSEFVEILGKEIDNEESIYYWCYKNNIPVFCPALTDGSIGDMISFFKYDNRDFKIDISDDILKINELAINAEKTGIIVLGGNFPKHHVCNANLFRGGADYAVYITLETEEGGSDSGARIDEAKSWGKVKPEAKHVKVYGDATIIFPLVVAGAFE